jgi:hypothetical protein
MLISIAFKYSHKAANFFTPQQSLSDSLFSLGILNKSYLRCISSGTRQYFRHPGFCLYSIRKTETITLILLSLIAFMGNYSKGTKEQIRKLWRGLIKSLSVLNSISEYISLTFYE